ncbi:MULTISPECIES: methyltransferase [Amycolatopsis]|uniref:Methyltransferase n=1 Tax=Amycolatopsis albidoflavus TaxID=102226 RepID=A0ABW5I9C1_9PSEU
MTQTIKSHAAPLTLPGLVPILFGHAAFQQLNAGFQLGLFALLADRPDSSKPELAAALGLPARSAEVLLLGTTALGLTTAEDGRYRNAEIIDAAFRDGSWQTLRDIVEFQARISYLPASDYAESLRTGRNVGIRHFPGDTEDLYSRLSNSEGMEELFYRGMNAWSKLSNPVLVNGPQFAQVSRVLDVGGGDAVNAIALAQAHPHLRVTVLDRPAALEVAEERVRAAGLQDRIELHAADIFTGEYPGGHDCVLFAHQLVIWTPEQNRELLGKAWHAVEPGGRVLIFNAFADDDGQGPLYAALDSVYFSTLPFAGSTLYPWHRYEEWLLEIGFAEITRVSTSSWTPHGVLQAIKS